MKKVDIRQFSRFKKLASLIQLYLKLKLPLAGALRAAKADLQMDSLPDATLQVLDTTRCPGSSSATSTRAAFGSSSDGFPNLTLTEVMNGVEAAAQIAKGLGQPVEGVVLTPGDLEAQVSSGAMRLPSSVESTYGASILEMVRQTYDGRLDFGATTTTVVEDLTGRKPLTLHEWVLRYRDSVLPVGAQAARGLEPGK